MDKDKYIGVCDSGLGGLTVVKGLLKQLPNENIVYLADNKNCPYGDKSPKEILKFTKKNCLFLLQKHNLKAILIACNTMDAIAGQLLKDNVSEAFVYGCILPTCKIASSTTKNNKIALLATTSTCNSHVYAKEMAKLNKNIEVYEIPCPKFVPLIEAGRIDSAEMKKALNEYLALVKKSQADTLILGCTHYPLLQDKIKKILPEVNIISSSAALVNEVKSSLMLKDLLSDNFSPKVEYYATNPSKEFIKQAHLLINEKVDIKEA